MGFKRLYVFTGKGGVGKTTCALSVANHLVQQGKKVLFVEFEPQVNSEIFEKLKINHYVLSLLESANGYIAKKLKSKVIASWVVKTPFFKSLINMIPGFSYIIFLGHLLEMVYNDPDLILVIDSPSSGHASTLFEACRNFQDMFRNGLIFDDIEKMLNFIHNPNVLQIIICAMPTAHEAIELKEHLSKLGFDESSLIFNNCLSLATENNSNLPEFIQNKIGLEKQVLTEFKKDFSNQLPHITETTPLEIIKHLTTTIKDFI